MDIETTIAVLHQLAADPLSGLVFRYRDGVQDDVTCVYCHAERPRKPPFHHLRNCPISRARGELRRLQSAQLEG